MPLNKAYMLRTLKVGHSSVPEIRKFSNGAILKRNVRKGPLADPDLICIRWGCTSNVPQKTVFNTAEAIHLVTDKKKFRLLCAIKKLAPLSWGDLNSWTDFDSFPVIVRPAVHAQGKHVILCKTRAELQAACAKFNSYYISEYIPKVAEYRVFVAQGRAVWVAKKTPGDRNAIAWNVAQGGRFDNVRFEDWPLKAVKTCIEAYNLSGLDFGGVDVMVDVAGKCYVLEINSAPSQTSPYRQECCAKAFVYMIEHGKKALPLIEEKGGYLKFIHPAIDNKAKVIANA